MNINTTNYCIPHAKWSSSHLVCYETQNSTIYVHSDKHPIQSVVSLHFRPF